MTFHLARFLLVIASGGVYAFVSGCLLPFWEARYERKLREIRPHESLPMPPELMAALWPLMIPALAFLAIYAVMSIPAKAGIRLAGWVRWMLDERNIDTIVIPRARAKHRRR